MDSKAFTSTARTQCRILKREEKEGLHVDGLWGLNGGNANHS